MKALLRWKYWPSILRIILGGIFAYAGMTKIGDPIAFADSIASFRLLPDELINIVALGLPPFEVLVGGALILGLFRGAPALSVVLLTTVFLAALAQALARGLEVDCGCFGAAAPSVWKTWESLARDVVLLVASIWLYGRCSKDKGRSPSLERGKEESLAAPELG